MRDYTIDISIDVTYEHLPEGKITFKSEILSDDTISKIFYEVDRAMYEGSLRKPYSHRTKEQEE